MCYLCVICVLCVVLFSVSLLNIREGKRFTSSAWRLAMLLPGGMKSLKESSLRVAVWHLAVKLIFKNYNKLLKEDFYVKCSDGQIRNIAMILSMWQGDYPEHASATCTISVRKKLYIFVQPIT